MSDRLIDSTLPAHDPTFAKPRGLSPVPPKVEESMASYEAGERKKGHPKCYVDRLKTHTCKRLRSRIGQSSCVMYI